MKVVAPLWSIKAWKKCSEPVVSFWYEWYRSFFGVDGEREGDAVFRRERNYVQLEKYYVPSQPNTEKQVAVRGVFREAVVMWQSLSSEEKGAWNYYQDYRRQRPVMSGYNLFISKYILSGGNPVIPPSGRRKDW